MQERFLIKGGNPIRGTLEVRGSKNVASKMMIASLLTDKECTIDNVPFSSETDITRELCENIGGKVVFNSESHSCSVKTEEIKSSIVPELSRRNRVPILAIGPLLHRKGVAEVPVLGGCPIGHRPLNFHMEALEKMGIRIERREHSYYAEAKKIHGAEISLIYPSVGATENIILTAVLAEGDTTIYNAAVEPEILNLIEFLSAMGAKIRVELETRIIRVNGVAGLKGAKIRVMPDRNEIVSFVTAALATDGEIGINNIEESYLAQFLKKIDDIGGRWIKEKQGIIFSGSKLYNNTFIETAPHPAFMTDWQQPFCVLLTQAQGESIVHETVYEDRFGYVEDLNQMGASIKVFNDCFGGACRFHGKNFNHSVKIQGPTPLAAREIEMTDIRAGMAHIIASLIARGESVVSGISHIDRGYEKLDERLRALGADIKRV